MYSLQIERAQWTRKGFHPVLAWQDSELTGVSYGTIGHSWTAVSPNSATPSLCKSRTAAVLESSGADTPPSWLFTSYIKATEISVRGGVKKRRGPREGGASGIS